MPTVKKLPKWAIKQAGGINKKAWALARRGRGQKKPSILTKKGRQIRRGGAFVRRGTTNRAATSTSKPGYGRWFKIGRTVDIFSGPAQGAVSQDGFTPAAGKGAINRYIGLDTESGEFDMEPVKVTAGSIGTGLLRDWIRSKMGVYRGLGQKKVLSGVMAANPEILASTEVNPTQEPWHWNTVRTQYDRGYASHTHRWGLQPGQDTGDRFWKSVGMDVGLKVTQKFAEHFLNPILPPGYNL